MSPWNVMEGVAGMSPTLSICSSLLSTSYLSLSYTGNEIPSIPKCEGDDSGVVGRLADLGRSESDPVLDGLLFALSGRSSARIPPTFRRLYMGTPSMFGLTLNCDINLSGSLGTAHS